MAACSSSCPVAQFSVACSRSSGKMNPYQHALPINLYHQLGQPPLAIHVHLTQSVHSLMKMTTNMVLEQVVAQAAALLPRSELFTMDCDHFSLYLDQNWEATIQKQLQFVRKHASEDTQFEVPGSK